MTYDTPGQIQNVTDHPDMNLPDPGHSPTPQHNTQMAGEVLPFPVSKQDIMPNTTQVKNDQARRSGNSGGTNVVKPIFK